MTRQVFAYTYPSAYPRSADDVLFSGPAADFIVTLIFILYEMRTIKELGNKQKLDF